MLAQTDWMYVGVVLTTSLGVGLYNRERTRNLLGSICMGIAVLSMGGLGAVLAKFALNVWFAAE